MLCAFMNVWFMPLYRNFCAPWPTWLLVPSHLSQPTVHPFLLAAAGVSGHGIGAKGTALPGGGTHENQ